MEARNSSLLVESVYTKVASCGRQYFAGASTYSISLDHFGSLARKKSVISCGCAVLRGSNHGWEETHSHNSCGMQIQQMEATRGLGIIFTFLPKVNSN